MTLLDVVGTVLFVTIGGGLFVFVVRRQYPRFERDPGYEAATGICSDCRGTRTAVNTENMSVLCRRCRGSGRAPVG